MIEAALVCERLKATDRLDLACHVALCAVRGAWAAGAAEPDETTVVAADSAGRLFETYAGKLWAECDDRLLREFGLPAYSGFASWVTYPIRCLRLAETVALLALRVRDDDPDLAREIADWLVRFAEAQPGITGPISDRYAVSAIPVAALLMGGHATQVEGLLRRMTVWVCDRHETGELGLAPVDAPPSEEVSRVLGGSFEHVGLQPRRQSQMAAYSSTLRRSSTFASSTPTSETTPSPSSCTRRSSSSVMARTSFRSRAPTTAGTSTPTLPR